MSIHGRAHIGGKSATQGCVCVCVCMCVRVQASAAIMRVLKSQLTHGALMEKGGLDEVFLDVTPMVVSCDTHTHTHTHTHR